MNELFDVFSLLDSAVEAEVFPGAAACVGDKNGMIYSKCVGKRDIYKDQPMRIDTLFDLASLSKVVSTMPVVMLLAERGKISLYDFVYDYLPEFEDDKNLKVINLLTHTSGFEPFSMLSEKSSDFKGAIRYIAQSKRVFGVGEKVLYSDYNFILLQAIIQKVTGETLDKVSCDMVFKKLHMDSTCYNPKYSENIAATEFNPELNKCLKGIVHDENARFFNGVSGHAGLFSNAEDLSRYCRMYLNDGKTGKDKVFFCKNTIDCITHNYTAHLGESRGLGFCIKKNGEKSSGGELISEGSFGHTGFTGTSLWIDKKLEIYIILLTNRVHPSRDNNKIIRFRRLFHNAVVSSFNK